MYSIGEFSKISGISVSTLRYYDQRGIIKPEIIKANGYRFYEDEQLLMAQFVNNLKNTGLSLDSITDIVNASEPVYTLQRITEQKYAKINEVKLLTDIENYYARALMNHNYNNISEENVEVSIFKHTKYITREIEKLDTRNVFTYECMELQKKRNKLNLRQNNGVRLFLNSFADEGKDLLLMPVSTYEDGFSKREESDDVIFIDDMRTISTLICKVDFEIQDDIKALSDIASSMGYSVFGAPILECLLDPGDLPSPEKSNKYFAKLHLKIRS